MLHFSIYILFLLCVVSANPHMNPQYADNDAKPTTGAPKATPKPTEAGAKTTAAGGKTTAGAGKTTAGAGKTTAGAGKTTPAKTTATEGKTSTTVGETTTVEAQTTPSVTGEYGGPMTEVVKVDGKTYYALDDPFMRWYEAKYYCDSNNMKLATVTSEKQLSALRESMIEPKFYGSYWIGARDSQLSRQVSWDDTEKELDTFIPTDYMFMYLEGYQTCVDFNTNGFFFAMNCNEFFGVLCEK